MHTVRSFSIAAHSHRERSGFGEAAGVAATRGALREFERWMSDHCGGGFHNPSSTRRRNQTLCTTNNPLPKAFVVANATSTPIPPAAMNVSSRAFILVPKPPVGSALWSEDAIEAALRPEPVVGITGAAAATSGSSSSSRPRVEALVFEVAGNRDAVQLDAQNALVVSGDVAKGCSVRFATETVRLPPRFRGGRQVVFKPPTMRAGDDGSDSVLVVVDAFDNSSSATTSMMEKVLSAMSNPAMMKRVLSDPASVEMIKQFTTSMVSLSAASTATSQETAPSSSAVAAEPAMPVSHGGSLPTE